MKKNNRGFTLIELMIVVSIIAMIVAFAYPNYRNSITKNNRVTVEGDLQSAAAAMATFRTQNFTYNNATLGSTGVFRNYSPDTGTPLYDLVFVVGSGTGATNATATTFTIVAKPKAGTQQAGNGALAINEQGQRCWDKTNDSICTPGTAGQSWQ